MKQKASLLILKSRLAWLFCFASLVALCAACSPPVSTRDLDAGTLAVFAEQTRSAASNQANVLGVIAAKAANETREAKDAISTAQAVTRQAQAQERFLLNVTQTAERVTALERSTALAASKTETAQAAKAETGAAEVSKTEQARYQATAQIAAATNAAQTPTARAAQTGTAFAEHVATETAVILVAQARAMATRNAENLKDEVARRQEQREIQAATLDARNKASYIAEFISVLWLPVGGALLAIALLVFIWQILHALVNVTNAHGMAKMPAPIPLTDSDGYTIGYLTPTRDRFIYQKIEQTFIEQTTESTPNPPLLLTDLHDAPRPVAESELLYGIIHRSALYAIVKDIMETGDWSQTRLANRVFPDSREENRRVAYTLSLDTKDAQGNKVQGGYSRVMDIFTTHNLIVNRRQGATGDWNQNAPRTVEEVFAILTNSALPLPALPSAATEPMLQPPARSRTRKPITSKSGTPTPQAT